MNNCQECKKQTAGLCKECTNKQFNPMNTPNQKSECCIECWQKAWTSTKGNFMHCCYPDCKCHSPTVATSEKGIYPPLTSEDYLNSVIPTPNESEDWNVKISKYQNECLKHFESYRGNVPTERDFTHSLTMFKDAVRNEAYQRGREEGAVVSNKWRKSFRNKIESEFLSLAVQEIEKEKKKIKYPSFDADVEDNFKTEGFNQGLDKAKSIISGLIKK